MRLSLRSLLLYTTAFCVSLGLTWLPYNTGALVIAVIGLCLCLVMPFRAWWRVALGAALCGFVSFVIAVVLGIGDLLTEYNEPSVVQAYQQRWLTVAIQLGAFVGGSIGLYSYAEVRVGPDADSSSAGGRASAVLCSGHEQREG